MAGNWMIAALLIAALTTPIQADSKQADKTDNQPKKPRVELPSGWEAKTPPKSVQVAQFAVNSELNAYFELLPEAKADFSDSLDLDAYAKLVKEASTKRSKLANRKETELTSGKIGDCKTVEYEVTGEMNGVKLHYRIIMVEFGDWFIKLTCWTTPSHWKAAQPKFEELVGHIN